MGWNDDIPAHWATARLDEVVAADAPIIYGILQPGPEQADGVPYVRPTEIIDGRIALDEVRKTTVEIAARYARSTLRSGDVLLSIVGTIGKVAFVPPELAGGNITQSSVRIRVSEAIASREWIAYALRTPTMKVQFGGMMLGTGVPRLNVAHVRETETPLPPLEEQRRIVAKLDAIFEQTRSTKVRLERLPALLKKLKRSILTAAFRGDLTKDWRAAHPDVEPASALLDRIRVERRRRWEDGMRAKGKALGKATYDEPLTLGDVADLPVLADGWCWAPTDLVCERITKGTTPSSAEMSSAGDVPYLKVYNLTFDGRIDFTIDPTYVSRATHEGVLARSRVYPGDVLMNIVGPPLGKVGVVDDRFPTANVNQAIALFRPLRGLDADYLAYFLLGPAMRAWADLSSKATSGQHNLTLELCRRIAVPVPPLEEQRAVVDALRSAWAQLAAIEASVEQLAQQTDCLERASLAKAFRGELVPRDPTDEPASVLLESVRAALATTPERPRRGRGQRAEETTTNGSGNGHATDGHHDESLDLVAGMFQVDRRLSAPMIAEGTGLKSTAVKKAIKVLVDSGQVSVDGRGRTVTYVWND